jgi:putative transposase
MKFLMIDAEKAHHNVSLLARVLGVSREGYYTWARRGESARAAEDRRLTEKIKDVHAASRETYGAPRVHAALADDHGVRVGRKRVARLMKAAGLQGVHRRRRLGLTKRGKRPRPAPDMVNREFTAPAPDNLWTADITYVPTLEGFLYLAIVLDVYSRKIVGWSMADHMRNSLVCDALSMALHNRRPATAVIHHSDQGSQYTSDDFADLCQRRNVTRSLGSVGDCYDNAITESFFATLECELIDRATFRSHAEARVAIFDFIEGFYNRRRRHSSLGYLSPLDYENQAEVCYAAA